MTCDADVRVRVPGLQCLDGGLDARLQRLEGEEEAVMHVAVAAADVSIRGGPPKIEIIEPVLDGKAATQDDDDSARLGVVADVREVAANGRHVDGCQPSAHEAGSAVPRCDRGGIALRCCVESEHTQ